jgi:hypothetical protein
MEISESSSKNADEIVVGATVVGYVGRAVAVRRGRRGSQSSAPGRSSAVFKRLNGAATRRLGTAFTIRTGDHNYKAIEIAKPNLPVSGCRVDVRSFDNLGLQPAGALHGRVKVVDLEPQHDTVSSRRRVCVDEIGVVFLVPSVQLKN